MLKVTLGALFQASQPRGQGKKAKPAILQELADSMLPVSTAYRVGKVLEKVQPELKNFDERRIELLKKFAKKDEKGELLKEIEFEEGQREGFNKEFEELLKIEVELDCKPINLSELSNVSMMPKEMGLVDFMFSNDL